MISRANFHNSYPADFMLAATMNPCPCGFYGDVSKECTCSLNQILTYKKRLSGPLLDRIDLFVSVSPVRSSDLLEINTRSKKQHNSAQVLVINARKRQLKRYGSSTKNNGNISSTDVVRFITLSSDVRELLTVATEKLQLSARSYFKVIKLARTIADLEDSNDIAVSHVSEALQYRQNT